MAGTAAAGYSGKPLAAKLGLKDGHTLWAIGAPADYAGWLGALPPGARIVQRAAAQADLVHLFATRAATLRTRLPVLRAAMQPDAAIWVSWPKKASGQATDIVEQTIRDIALPTGLVDVKVCAVSEIWSGLKLVLRKELRAEQAARLPPR